MKRRTSPNVSRKGVGLTVDALRGHVGYGTRESIALQQTAVGYSGIATRPRTVSPEAWESSRCDTLSCTNSNVVQMQAREDAVPLPAYCLQKR